MYVRALAVVTMVVLVPLALVSGIVPWLAPDVRRAGQQVLLLALTKRDWVDVHTAVTMGAILVATTHVVVVRTGLVADVRLLATGQRSAPSARAPLAAGAEHDVWPCISPTAGVITLAGVAEEMASGRPTGSSVPRTAQRDIGSRRGRTSFPGGRVAVVVLALLLAGCGSTPADSPSGAAISPAITTSATTTALPAATPVATPEKIAPPPPTATPAPAGFPLAEPGPYAVGMRSLPTIPDPSRDDRPVSIRVWYPALQSSGPTGGSGIVNDAPPDPSGGPYPVILSSSKIANIFAPYLVSHGFAWISVAGSSRMPG